MSSIKIKFYGTRGSYPSSGEKRRVFGGNTTCIVLSFGDKKIMLDTGSGASEAIADLEKEKELDLFISHLHLDHLSGIVSLIPAFSGRKLNIYGRPHSGVSVRDAIYRVMSEPIWPVSPDKFGCVEYFDLPKSMTIHGVEIDTMESNHPGGSTLFRFTYGGKSVVTALDFCHLDGYAEKLAEFAKGCDVLIYDGAMDEKEFAVHSSWGHSTAKAGAMIAKKCGCRLIIAHHGPCADDAELIAAEKETRVLYENSVYAKDGMTVEI